MSALPSITVDNVIVAIGNFIRPLVPAEVEIARGWTNRVAPPKDPFILLTEVGQYDLSTTRNNYFNDGQSDISEFQRSTRIDIQCDFFGDQSGEMARTIKTLFRSLYAPEQFPDNIKPLYCTDAMSSPLITGEEQYRSRWTITISLQYNPKVTIEYDQFDNVGETSIIAADLIPD